MENYFYMSQNLGTLQPNFNMLNIGTHGKLMVLGVPILKHFRVAMLRNLQVNRNKLKRDCNSKGNFLEIFHQIR